MGTSLLKKLYDLKLVSGCFRGGTLSKSDTTQNTNIVLALAKAGNWGQAGLAVGAGLASWSQANWKWSQHMKWIRPKYEHNQNMNRAWIWRQPQIENNLS